VHEHDENGNSKHFRVHAMFSWKQFYTTNISSVRLTGTGDEDERTKNRNTI
jgi:hypothetical protein